MNSMSLPEKDWIDMPENVSTNDFWAVWFGAFKKFHPCAFNFSQKSSLLKNLLCAKWKYLPTYNYILRKNVFQEWEQNEDIYRNTKMVCVTNGLS